MHPVRVEYRTYTFFNYSGRSPIGSTTFGGFHGDGKGWPTWRVLDFYAMIYAVRGRARYADANGIKKVLQPGDLLINFPGIGHNYIPLRGEQWSEIWFTFSGPVFDLWRDKGLLDPARPIRQLLPIDYWHRRLELLLEMGQRLSGRNAAEQACALQLVLAEMLGSDVGTETVDEEQLWLSQASACLDVETLQDAPSLEDVAVRMKMSYDQFRRRFKVLAGITPCHYRVSRIMDRACRLMQSDGLTNRELSEHLGFSSEFHFSRRFKQVVGITPKFFRQRLDIAAEQQAAEERNATLDAVMDRSSSSRTLAEAGDE